MIVEFKVTRLDDKIVGVESNTPNFRSLPPQLPLVTTKRVQVSVYSQLPKTAPDFYQSLIRQMKGGNQ